jgi:hypothetical protein
VTLVSVEVALSTTSLATLVVDVGVVGAVEVASLAPLLGPPSVPDDVGDVLLVSSPGEIDQAVVSLVTVQVTSLLTWGPWTYEGLQHQDVDESVPPVRQPDSQVTLAACRGKDPSLDPSG